MSDLSELGKRALALVDLGYAVFPLVPNEKTPLTSHGHKDASTDRGHVGEWWRANPKANIGITTGGGLVVIDVDRLPKDGHAKAVPNPWLEPVNEKLESLGADSVVRSPTGGFHLYFEGGDALHELGAIKNSVGSIAKGIDVRSDGGYIVAPGSVIDGREYSEVRALVARSDLPKLPETLIGEFRRMKRGKSSAKPGENSLTKILKGNRHDALTSEAGRLRGHALCEEALLAELRHFNTERCSPPQEDSDLVRLAHDFAKKDAAETWGLVTKKMSEIEEKAVEWLIGLRIPRGMITTFVGMPGAGKSMLCAFIASKISTGQPLQVEGESWAARPPGRVLMFALEDAADIVLRPRLEAMGADLERIEVCEVKSRGDTEQGIDLLNDFALIERKVIEMAPDAIIIDPVNSAWGKGKDQNDDVQVREVLGPYKRLAEARRLAVILITHTNKRSDVSDAQDSASGARAIVGLARTVYLVGRLRDEDGEHTHYLCDMKPNLRAQLPALKFRIDGDGDGSVRARITVIGIEDMDANEFMREKAKRAREERQAQGDSRAEEAKRTAQDVLTGNGGAMLSTELERVLIEEKDLAKKTVQQATKALVAEKIIERRKERTRDGKTWVFFKGKEPAELREDR